MPVGTALPVGLLQALVVADGYQGVLKPVPVRQVVVGVISGHHRSAGLAGQVHQPAVALHIALHQVLLQLDEDVGRAEPVLVLLHLLPGMTHLSCGQQCGEPSLAAAGEQYQALSMLGYVLGIQPGLLALAGDVRVGGKPGQVVVALPVLDQKGQVGAVLQG